MFAAAMALLAAVFFSPKAGREMPWQDFMNLASTGGIDRSSVVVESSRVTAKVTPNTAGITDKTVFANILPQQSYYIDDLTKQGIAFTVVETSQWPLVILGILPYILVIGVIIFIARSMRGAGGGPGGMLGSFGKSRHRLQTKEQVKITFGDVAGVDEAKDEVHEIVQFLKTPGEFSRLGGRIPRGVLLSGPPGCGKTLLAKAIAGEADVPFYSISGSDFVEMFVGVGASRVRDLFKQAKETSPCIIFLDEIDAVGRRRGGGFSSGGHDEREQTLNAILVEMDGFDANAQVIVIASTNRDLQEQIAAGRFREDLFYRLNVVPVKVPALKERREDIPALVQHFMQQTAKSSGLPEREIGEDAMTALQAHTWPGNVRQLRNVVEWLLIMAPGDAGSKIRADMLPPEILDISPAVLRWDKASEMMGLPLRDAREVFEREYLAAQILRFGGNITRTASFVGMERSALHRKLKSLGLTSVDSPFA